MSSADHTDDRHTTTRVDASHLAGPEQLADAEPVDRNTLWAMAGRLDEQMSDQLHRQASELGERLQSQQRELDRREAEFNARAARLENELRTARLIYRERQFTVHEQQTNFERRYEELRQRNADLAAAQAALDQEAEEKHQVRTSQLDEARHSVEVWQKRLRQLEQNERTLQTQLADVNAQQRRLDQHEADLARREHEQAETRAADQQRVEAQLQKLRERSEQLERRRTAVQQLHAEVSRIYREALEMRICTEEIWGQIQPGISPAELTQKLARLQRKLSDQYQLANQSLCNQKQEVQELLDRLGEHETHLSKQRDEVRGWVARRQDELEAQATKLLDREQQLSKQSADLRRFERDWKQQRAHLEGELQRLRHFASSQPSDQMRQA